MYVFLGRYLVFSVCTLSGQRLPVLLPERAILTITYSCPTPLHKFIACNQFKMCRIAASSLTTLSLTLIKYLYKMFKGSAAQTKNI